MSEDTTNFETRWRGTLEEARLIASRGNTINHVLDNQDGTYSVMSHIVCEYCDYCAAGDDYKTTVHVAKSNSYEDQGQ